MGTANWFAPEGMEPRYEYTYRRQTGSKHLHQSTLLFGKMSDFLICLHLENSWSRQGRRKSNEPDLRESGCS